MGTEIEFLAIGNCILHKEKQKPELARDHKSAFELD
jgi:carbamoyltransferase